MKRLEYELEFITPAFIGGANPQEAELRPSSIVGMLRWWFRVLVGAWVNNTEELFKLESELFGSQERAGKVWVRVLNPPNAEKINIKSYRYLIGLSNRNIGFKEGSKFKLIVITPVHLRQFVDFLVRFTFTFGNIGNRARKGFGSVDFRMVNQLINPKEHITLDNLRNTLNPILDKFTFNTENKEFPNISNMVILEKPYNGEALSELSRLSRVYRDYRTRNGSTREYEEVLSDYMDKRIDCNRIKGSSFKNHMFGLPIMFSSRKRECPDPERKNKKIKAQAQLSWSLRQSDGGDKEKDKRRAAPFWISFKRNKVYVTLFESKFLPEEALISIQAKGRYWKICKNTNPPKMCILNYNFPENYSYIKDLFIKYLGFKQVFYGGSLK